MPFGLKNAGATYLRAMTALFHDMMNKEMEVYVDDMIDKSWAEEDPAFEEKIDTGKEDCQRAFDKVKKYLFNPPILVPPTPGRPLLMHL